MKPPTGVPQTPLERSGTPYENKRGLRPLDTGLDAGQGLFEKMLARLTESAERSPYQIPQSALSQDILQHLIGMIEAQMTVSLFRAISEEDPAGEETASNGPWTEVPFSLPHSPSSPRPAPTGHGAQEPMDPETLEDAPLTPIDRMVHEASNIHDVDPALVKAVIKAESDYDANATSPKGAMGLMQLMPETARDLGVKEPYDPRENIMAGTRYLKTLLNRYEGNIPLALAGYNWGMGNVERNPGKLPEETRTYISRVNDYYREITS